jgi:two-component sensor histidine kinase
MDSLVRRGLRPGSFEAYGFAVACVLAATLLRLLIDFVAPNSIFFATFVPALLAAALVGGAAAGMVATVLGGFVAWWIFFEPRFVWVFSAKEHFVSVCLYLFAGALIVWTANQYRIVLARIDEEEKFRRIIVDELSHRVKNKLATIYAVMRHELRDQPDIWDSVSGRLQALSAADDFIGRDEEGGVGLHKILGLEMGPFGEDRFSIDGPPVRLFGKTPTVLALLLHELATNAAKYGALSRPNGHVHVSWHRSVETFVVTWTERGGPEVTTPSRRGFGSHLIEQSLETFGGAARLEFPREGAVCRITLPETEVQPDRV